MGTVWASVVAVAGTLLGSVVTHLSQRRASRHGEVFARSEALRQERLSTYSGFATALEEYRHGQLNRWHRRRDDPDGADGESYLRARDEAHQLRTASRQALYRVKLLVDDSELLRAAELAYEHTRDISTALDRADHEARNAQARQAIESFVAAAAPLVR